MNSWQEIPIFIVNRNRVSSLKAMIQWLLGIGCHDVQILDNDSSYPALLDYYQRLPGNVTLHKLGENIGPRAFWQLGLQKKYSSPYIVSDPDLVPAAFCPDDLIAHMHHLLSRFPDCGKVAPGLRLDSVSPNYGQADAAVKWESQFWHRPVSRGIFFAPVDTTFAIYAAGSEFTRDGKNLRLGYPYLLEHTPWQVDENNLDEEETYYRAHTSSSFSHWSPKTPDSRMENLEFFKRHIQRITKTIVHLGCGNEYIPGWINIDISGRKLDIQFDLNKCRSRRLPLEDNSVDGFYMCHVFEYIEDTIALMEELYRIARNGSKIHLRMPHGASDDALGDPAIARAYFESSFAYFSQPAYSRAESAYMGDWQAGRITLVVAPSLLEKKPDHAYQIIKTQRNIVSEMVVELSAVKPARARLSGLLKNCELLLTSDARIVPKFDN
jgi:SAM-dependent methyltransferase